MAWRKCWKNLYCNKERTNQNIGLSFVFWGWNNVRGDVVPMGCARHPGAYCGTRKRGFLYNNSIPYRLSVIELVKIKKILEKVKIYEKNRMISGAELPHLSRKWGLKFQSDVL